jgi:transposase/uncharacterized coiled-coil protein SlyX
MKEMTGEIDYKARYEELLLIVEKQQEIIEKQSSVIQKQEFRIAELEARVAELEARLGKDSDNSHKPPSSDNPFTKTTKSQREKSGKKSGGQPGHTGKTLKRVSYPDEVLRHSVTCCSGCGCDLSSEKARKELSRQVFDIPKVSVKVTEHRAEVKDCPHCGKRNEAAFPEGVTNHTQYGNNIRTLVVALKMIGFVSLERISELVWEQYGIRLSQATMEAMLFDLDRKIRPFEPWVKDRLLSELVLNADETGVRVEGKLNWFHSLSSERYSWFEIHQKRGVEAMKKIGLLQKYCGIVVHDFWESYLDFDFLHSFCNAHLLRELVFQYEALKQDWAWDMGGLLKRMKESVALDNESKAAMEAEYDRILDRGYLANPLPETPPGRKGKKKRGKVLCLLDRFRDHKSEVLRFLWNPLVPFTNNQAERDVRMMKIQQKVSGTFRSREGADAFCRIMSFVSTARKLGRNACEAIADAFRGVNQIWAAV